MCEPFWWAAGHQDQESKVYRQNNSLLQEFCFAHPQTKVKVNNIYNSHFTGSQLWKFGSNELGKFESTYRSVKLMYDLPLATHRFFIEPLSGVPHFSRILVRRYLSFIEKIKKSSKVALNQLLEMTTGANLGFIMILTGLNRVEDLKPGKVDFEYHKVEKTDEWKIGCVKELVNVKQEELNVFGTILGELDEILEYLVFIWFSLLFPGLKTGFPASYLPKSSTHKTILNSLV